MIYVVVEGPSDEGFIEGIAKRIGVTEIKVHRMRGNRLDKLRRLVNALYTEGKVIVLKDEHWNPSLVDSVERGLGGLAKVIRVKCSIESWILIGLCAEQSERCDDPVKRLKEYLGTKDRVKSEVVYKGLAEKIDIEKLKKHSMGFREFLEAISS
ncbi:MAG: hypothetical protein LM590_04360 [Thermofilum sp.]|nr:hypothetical protein [Thermofilum sp.]